MTQVTRINASVSIGVLFTVLFVLPWVGLPYGEMDWVALGQPYEPPVTATATNTPVVTLTPTSATPKRVFLSLVRRNQSIAIPTPTPAPEPIANSDFEDGRAGWGEVSSNERALIRMRGDLSISPHSGDWAAWLGGVADEVSAIGQQIAVPAGATQLSYWIWIDSEDDCDAEVGGIVFDTGDDVEAADGYWLCRENNTQGWQQRVIDIENYAGSSVGLVILAENNDSRVSNLYIDDVRIEAETLSVTVSNLKNTHQLLAQRLRIHGLMSARNNTSAED